MIGGIEYNSVNVRPWVNQTGGGFDLAVVEVDEPFGSGEWYPLYTGSSELNLAIDLVGYGLRGQYDSGTGLWNVVSGSYGTRRVGSGAINVVYTNVITFPFSGGSNPSNSMAAPGDSGGGLFASFSETTTLVGITLGSTGYPSPSGYTTAQRISAAQLWILGFETGFTLCHAFTATLGYVNSGNVSWVFYNDTSRLLVESRPPSTPSGPSVQVVFEGHAPHLKADVTSLTHTLVSRCSATPVTNIEQRIELWDWTAGAWELVSTSTPSSSDTTVVADPTGTTDSRFVQSVTELVKARVSFYEVGAIANVWHVEVNQAKWTIQN